MFGLVPFGGHRGLARSEQNNPFALFDSLFDHDFPAATWGASSFKVVLYYFWENYEIYSDLPGVTKEDINLRYENGYLTIAAVHNESKDEKDDNGNYIRRERHTGEVSRSFYIDGIDDANIHAEFKNGVLQVSLPKAADAPERKQIEIH